MIETTDKAGQKVYVTYVNDCEDNAGGFYCETYSDENCDHKIDDFCVHLESLWNYSEPYSERAILDRLKEYIRDYYKDEVLNLEFNFD